MKKQEETVIERIVRYSKNIFKLRLYKELLIKARSNSAETGVILHTSKYFQEMLDEVDSRIKEINLQLKGLILPLLTGRNILGYNEESNIWALSSMEMKQGYLILEELKDPTDTSTGSSELILFLSDYTDKTNNITAGTILPKKKCANILGNQKSLLSDSLKHKSIFHDKR
jgi:hypothetical protein